jgi:hypothetical protein
MRARDTAFTLALAVTFGLAACQQNGATSSPARGLDVAFSATNTTTLSPLDASAMNATTAADVTFVNAEVAAQPLAPATVTLDAGASATTSANAPATDLRDGGAVVRDVAMVPGDVMVAGDAGIVSNHAAAQGPANPNVVYVPVPVPVTVPVFGDPNSALGAAGASAPSSYPNNVPAGNVPPTNLPATPSLGNTGTNLNGTIPGGPIGASPGVPPSAPPGAFPPPPVVPPSAVPPMPSAPPGAFGIPAPPTFPAPR